MTLPHLKPSFFNLLDPASLKHLLTNPELFSESFMPVAQWDGKLIIATSNEEIRPDIGMDYILLRANELDLKKLYHETLGKKDDALGSIDFNASDEGAKEDFKPSESPKLEDKDTTNNYDKVTFPDPPETTETENPLGSLDFSDHSSKENTNQSHAIPSEIAASTDEDQVDIDEKTNVLNFEELTNTVNSSNNIKKTSGKSDLLDLFQEYFPRLIYLKLESNCFKIIDKKGEWQESEFALKEVGLDQNSIFKIPYRTKRPYHGYVVPNSINNAFFQTFNGGRIPEHVTILPVIENDQITGEILGICSKEKAKELDLESLSKKAILDNDNVSNAA